MSDISGMEMKFTVIKNDDIERYLDARDKSELSRILWKIEQGRYEEGKEASNTYLVVNVDEPYAPKIIEIMKANNHWEVPDDQNQMTAQIVNDQLVLTRKDG